MESQAHCNCCGRGGYCLSEAILAWLISRASDVWYVMTVTYVLIVGFSAFSSFLCVDAAQFSEKLASIMKKILLISEVASLGRAFERYVSTHKDEMTRRRVSVTSYGVNSARLRGMITSVPDESQCADGDETGEFVDVADAKYVIDPDDRHPMTGALSQTQKGRILTLLGQWSEPTLAEKKTDASPTVNEVLQFRRALEYLHTSYPFSRSFGLADRRETTIESSQEVYERLLLRSPDPDTLNFDVIALLGVDRDGELDCDKLKALIKLFRPDRDGTMECVDFVKSVDGVYKELRLLRASVANSSKIDRAFETIFNLVFYSILFCMILSQLGYDPLALFLSISGVILAFAFMIGSASSKCKSNTLARGRIFEISLTACSKLLRTQKILRVSCLFSHVDRTRSATGLLYRE